MKHTPLLAALAPLMVVSVAAAETGQAPPPTAASSPPPAAAPPPGHGYPPPYGYPPPPGWAPYPPGYPPPYGYAAPVPVPATPYRYKEGTPLPAGYKVEERPIKGLVIAGSIVLGTAYFLGLMIAADDDFPNKSGYLLIPGIGPWITLATRDDHCNHDTPEDERIDCVGDFFVGFALVIDGAIQTAGGAMLLSGLLAQRKYVVPDDAAPRAASGSVLFDLRLRPVATRHARWLALEGRF